MNIVIQHPNELLRQKSREIGKEEFGSQKLERIILKMQETLSRCEEGVALAAPQIGEHIRLFIVSPKMKAETLVYINPKIVKSSSKKIVHEEGCLSLMHTYGKIKRAEKVSIEAYDERGRRFERGASGLLAEIYQHEIDHLDGRLFIDKAWDLKEILPKPRMVFFGTPRFAVMILEELEKGGLLPELVVTAPDKPVGRKLIITPPPVKVWAEKRKISVLQPAKLKNLEFGHGPWDLFLIAAYGKIIPQNILDMPTHGALNIHPSLLPRHRGPSPIQTAVLEGDETTGVSIMKLDAEMDHGPILAKDEVSLKDWKPHALELEGVLAEMGAKLFLKVLPKYLIGKLEVKEQNHAKATYTKKISTDDAFVPPEEMDREEIVDRKIRAFYPNPGAYTFFEIRGKKIRVKLLPQKRVIPEGKKEMHWDDFQKLLS